MLRTIYRALLRLYPYDYRVWFGGDMLAAFDRRAAECRAAGAESYCSFAFRELIGLATGAAAEWQAKLTTDPSVRARSVPDLRMMRPPGVPREIYFARACINAWRGTLPE